jgi:hypothetical protein
MYSTNTTTPKFAFDKDSYYCKPFFELKNFSLRIYGFSGDRTLMQSLVYDAKITEWFSKNSSTSANEKG